MVLAVRNREPTPIGRQSIACNRDTLRDRHRLMTKALAFHSHSVNYFRLARRPKIGHRPISGLQRRPSQNLHNLQYLFWARQSTSPSHALFREAREASSSCSRSCGAMAPQC